MKIQHIYVMLVNYCMLSPEPRVRLQVIGYDFLSFLENLSFQKMLIAYIEKKYVGVATQIEKNIDQNYQHKQKKSEPNAQNQRRKRHLKLQQLITLLY